MSEPIRTPTNDANAGVTSKTVGRVTARQTVAADKKGTSLDSVVQQVGSKLGNALGKRANAKAAEAVEAKRIRAASRQGLQKSISEVDKNRKRVGFEKFLFGEDPTYESVQIQAGVNAVKEKGLERLATIDDYAGHTPEEYIAELEKDVQADLEKYDDPRAKEAMLQEWEAQARRLGAKQYQGHYGYKLSEARKDLDKTHALEMDGWGMYAEMAITPEELGQVVKKAEGMFDLEQRPQYVSKEAKQDSLLKQTILQLEAGNIGAHNVATAAGFQKTLTERQMTTYDAGIKVYDQEYSQRVDTTLANTQLAMQDPDSVETVEDLYTAVVQAIDAHDARGSKTDRHHEIIAEARAKANRMRLTGLKAGANASAKAENKLALQSALREPDAINRSGKLTDIIYTPKEIKEANDANIRDMLAGMSGNPEATTEEATQYLLQNPQAAKAVMKYNRMNKVGSDVLKKTALTMIRSFDSLANEDGQFDQRGLTAITAMEELFQDPALQVDVGAKQYDEWLVMRDVMKRGGSVDRAKADIKAYNDSAGKADTYAARWPVLKGESKPEYVQRKLSHMIPNMSPRVQAEAMEVYDRGLRVNGYDHNEATTYMNRYFKGSQTEWNGHTLNDKALMTEKVNGEHLPAVLDFAESDNLMGGMMDAAFGKRLGDKSWSKLSQKTDAKLYTGPQGQLMLDSGTSKRPMAIPDEVLDDWSKRFKQRRKQQQLERELRARIDEKRSTQLSPIM